MSRLRSRNLERHHVWQHVLFRIVHVSTCLVHTTAVPPAFLAAVCCTNQRTRRRRDLRLSASCTYVRTVVVLQLTAQHVASCGECVHRTAGAAVLLCMLAGRLLMLAAPVVIFVFPCIVAYINTSYARAGRHTIVQVLLPGTYRVLLFTAVPVLLLLLLLLLLQQLLLLYEQMSVYKSGTFK